MGRLYTISTICFLLYVSRVAYPISRRYEPVEIRLSGERDYEGRVEVFNGGTWGRLCVNGLTRKDANVICRTLGFTHATDQRGVNDADLPSLRCVGNETNIAFCPYTHANIHDSCYTRNWVSCEGIVQVRLENSQSNRKGRVGVFHRGSWGTVCANNFGYNDANVVCRMLGFGFVESYGRGTFGQGSGDILNDIYCSGDELNIGQCDPSFDGTSSCTHEDDVAVSCAALPVRLVNGNSPNEGRVEVHFDGAWGTICDDEWDRESGKVVCRMLGYPGVARTYILAFFGQGTGEIILDNTQCNGRERHISLCGDPRYGEHNCDHSEDSGVVCSGKATADIRLVDGPDPSHGRLELNLLGTWGTACRRNWTSIDSSVVCRKLGYFGAADTLSEATSYGRGTGMVLLREPRCKGKEADLLQCDVAYPIGLTDCTHDEDVWVRCLQKEELEVRLVGGAAPNEGRIEVLHRGRWGTICDDGWDILDSNVVCKMLGYTKAEEYTCCARSSRGEGDIVLDEVQCNGSEENLGHCLRQDYGVHDCDHSEDVGVSCIMTEELSDYKCPDLPSEPSFSDGLSSEGPDPTAPPTKSIGPGTATQPERCIDEEFILLLESLLEIEREHLAVEKERLGLERERLQLDIKRFTIETRSSSSGLSDVAGRNATV